MRPASHLIPASILALLLAGAPSTFAQSPDPTGSSTFVIVVDGVRIGTETVSLTRTGDDWILSGTGFIRPPLDVTTSRLEIRYGPDWQPQNMTMVTSMRGEPLAISTTFGLTTASNALVQSGKRTTTTQDITPRSAVIPNNFFAAYESLALRLGSTLPSSRIPIYVPPSGETMVTVAAITPRRVSLGDRTIDLREFALTAMSASGVIPIEIWIDDRGRLARMVMPTASLVVIREDLAHVMAREERLAVAGDEDVLIGSSGFAISGTLTLPQGLTDRAPAVVLVGGHGPQDRDYVSHGIPIYAHVAKTLADAGYVVLRYDTRGVGRSGGRPESSRLQEYTDDVLTIVNWLRGRREVDRDRIAVAGYGDAGAVVLLAASRTNRISAVALLNAPGRSGREVTIERQRTALTNDANISEAERQTRLALQLRVMDAVTSGRGWDDIPADVRHQADTLWFRSWLLYDPAEAMRRTRQPVLILHGALDSEVPADHANQLHALGAARRNQPPTHTRVVVLPNVNHLLTEASTGSASEYATAGARELSPEVGRTLTAWLTETLVRR